MWSEQTIINPQAWSPQVEYDLTQSVRRQLGLTLDQPDARPEPIIGDPVEGIDGAFDATRRALAECDVPQIVHLAPGGVELVPFPVPSAEEHAHFESIHESARVAAMQETALLSRIEQIRRSNEHQEIERAARAHEWWNAEEANLGAELRRISGGATAPAFASTINIGSGLVPATLDTSLTAPTNVTTLATPGASGMIVSEIVFQAVGTVVAGVVNVFRHDGTTYHLIAQVLVTATTSSTTAVAWATSRQYTNFNPKSGDTVRVSNTVAGNQSLIKAHVLGGDL